MRFTLCIVSLLLAAPAAGAQGKPSTALDHFQRGESAWKRSCKKPTRGLCIVRRSRPMAESCSGERRSVRVIARDKRAARTARTELERAIRLADAVLDTTAVSERERTEAERARAGALFYLAELEMESMLRGAEMPILDFDPAKPKRAKRDTKRFRTWLDDTKKRMEAATKAYQPVLKSEAVPAFRVAAAGRLVEISARFAEMLDDAVVPPFIRNDRQYGSEMRKAYCEALDSVAKPLRQRAVTATDACLELAKAAGLGASDTAKCKKP